MYAYCAFRGIISCTLHRLGVALCCAVWGLPLVQLQFAVFNSLFSLSLNVAMFRFDICYLALACVSECLFKEFFLLCCLQQWHWLYIYI